nr:uncharacterized protein LOC127299832 isoform X2 [Lolium perenne]
MRRGRGVQPSGPLGGDGARPRRPAVGSMRRRCGATVGATVDSMDGWAPRGGAKVGAALEARWSAPSTDARDLHQYEHPQVQQYSMNQSTNRPQELLQQVPSSNSKRTVTYKNINVPEGGCSLSIREDLLNKYAEETLNYCTAAAASNSTLHNALDSSPNLVKEKEQQILQLQNELDFVSSQLYNYELSFESCLTS